MSYDPRSIAFVGEILYPPMQLRSDLVQAVHNSLFRQPALSYQSFQVAGDGIHLTNLPMTPGQVSSVSFTPDRMVLREEMRGTTLEDFATRLVNVAGTAFTALSIPVSVAQQFCIRSLISSRQKVDSREFLARRVLENGEALAGFGRPLQSLGLRLFFPPTEADRATYQVRIENWPLEPRSLWVEVVGSFGNAVAAGDLPKVAEQLYATYGFLTNQVGSFLAAHDGT